MTRNRRKPRMRADTYDRQLADLPINAEVAVDLIDDPFVLPGQRHKIKATRSLRDDTLGRMWKRHQIDEPGYMAGREYQRLHEAVEIGSVGTVDPTREYVDGGRLRDPLTDRQLNAGKRLLRIRVVLGIEGADLVEDVLGAGMSLAQAAIHRGGLERSYQEYLGRRFRECLATMAVEFGLSARASAGQREVIHG